MIILYWFQNNRIMNFYPIKTVAADRLYITQAVTLGTSDKWVVWVYECG
jgi:hypothetical protein